MLLDPGKSDARSSALLSPSANARFATRTTGAGRVAILWFAVAAAACIALQVATARPALLFGRPLWLDEYLTHLIVSDPDVVHAVAAVRGGVDTNPPVLHLLLRAIAAAAGGPSPGLYRMCALLSVWIALVATFVSLSRSLRFLPAAIGSAMVWQHSLVIANAFEARFYGPMLALAAVMCAALGGRRSAASAIAVATAAALLCTIHYFGIIVLGCIVAGELAAACLRRRAGERQALRVLLPRLAPAVAGPIALFPFLHFIADQRSGLLVDTWVPTPGLALVRETVTGVVPIPELVALIALCTAWKMCGAAAACRATGGSGRQAAASPCKPLAGLLGLLLLPPVILLFSLLVQPAFLPRYLIPTTLGFAAVAALLAASLSRPLQVTVLVGLLALAAARLHTFAIDRLVEQRELARSVSEIRALDAESGPLPIVTPSRRRAYELVATAPTLQGRVLIADLRSLSAAHELTQMERYESDMAVKVTRFYPVPTPADHAHLRELGRFVFHGQPAELQRLRSQLPLNQLAVNVYEVARE